MELYPESKELFIQYGFELFTDEQVARQFGGMLKLKTALRSKQINPEMFIRILRERIETTKTFRKLAARDDAGQQPVNLLSLLPCPLMVPMQKELISFVEYLREEKNLSLNCCIEAFFNQHVNFEDYLQCFETADEIPDVLMTAGYSFLYKNFVERFIRQGVFADLPERPVNPSLAAAGLVDPAGCVAVIAVNVLVMVVDRRRLGDLPLPAAWDDLLRPEYRQKVVIRGHDGYFCDIVQMNYYKDHGTEGVEKLARAVCYGLHPAQMVKELNSGRQDVPPIHIMPYFFYKTMRERPEVVAIWPEEGALAYPVSVLVKADKMQKLRELVEFLTGPRIADICAGAYFPALHPDVPLRVPDTARFKWLGWDYIQNYDMEELLETVNNLFLASYREGSGGGCG